MSAKNKSEEYDDLPFGEMVDLSDSFYKYNRRKWYRNILTCYLVRLILSITVMEKSFHPDENQQGLEIAYKMAFGDQVDVVTTWEWLEYYGLRNTLYPAFLSIPLHLLRFLNLDSNINVIVAPLFMNGILQTMGDYFGFLLAERLINNKTAMIFLSYSLFNARINELFSRTMTNGAEATCAMLAFYHFTKLQFVNEFVEKKGKSKSNGNTYLVFEKNMAIMTFSITLAFLVRSSSLIGWIPLALVTILQGSNLKCICYNLLAIVKSGICVTIPMCLFSICIDSIYYGKPIIP